VPCNHRPNSRSYQINKKLKHSSCEIYLGWGWNKKEEESRWTYWNCSGSITNITQDVRNCFSFFLSFRLLSSRKVRERKIKKEEAKLLLFSTRHTHTHSTME
jgi:hypothetical protein